MNLTGAFDHMTVFFFFLFKRQYFYNLKIISRTSKTIMPNLYSYLGHENIGLL